MQRQLFKFLIYDNPKNYILKIWHRKKNLSVKQIVKLKLISESNSFLTATKGFSANALTYAKTN